MADLIFDSLDIVEVPVSIGGKAYVLREADAETARRYRNALLRSTKFNDEGKATSIEGMADVEPLLVSLCLFEAGSKDHVPLATIGSWPNRIVRPLFDRIKEISGLDDKGDKAKNSPPATTDISA